MRIELVHWFKLRKRLAALDLRTGDTVALTARVTSYTCGHKRLPDGTVRSSQDYQLSYVSRAVVIARALRPLPALPPHDATVSKRDLILVAVNDLLIKRGAPPTPNHLITYLGISPMNLLTTLRVMVRAGQLCFCPDGSILPVGIRYERSI